MKQMPQIMLAVLVAALAAAPAAADEQSYVIKFDRPGKVGDKSNVKMTGALKHERAETLVGKPLPAHEQITAVELDAQAVVEELDKRGLAKRISYTVRKCIIVEGDQQRPLLDEGAVFVAVGAREGTTFSLKDGGKLTGKQEMALRLLIHITYEDLPSLDELFGTEQRQKPGASWKVNVEKAVTLAAHYGTIIEPRDMEGTVRFVGVEKTDGRERIKITGETRTRRLEMKEPAPDADDARWLPKGLKFSGGTRETSFTALHGVEPDTSSSTTATSFDTFTIEGKREDGSDYKTDAKMTHTVVAEWVPQ